MKVSSRWQQSPQQIIVKDSLLTNGKGAFFYLPKALDGLGGGLRVQERLLPLLATSLIPQCLLTFLVSWVSNCSRTEFPKHD